MTVPMEDSCECLDLRMVLEMIVLTTTSGMSCTGENWIPTIHVSRKTAVREFLRCKLEMSCGIEVPFLVMIRVLSCLVGAIGVLFVFLESGAFAVVFLKATKARE